MSNIYDYTCFILLLPLLTFLLPGLFGKKFPRISGILGTTSMLIVTVLAYLTAYHYFITDAPAEGYYWPYGSRWPYLVLAKFTWLRFNAALSLDMGIALDPLSVMMLVVVSTVSLMVHLYSTGYMKGEERYSTYFSFLSLFTFSMLGLVVASNIFQIYIFWELVGVSSFLLIGFYFDKPSAVAAAKKAFIVTRFADLGFLCGILILSFYSGSLDFRVIIERMSSSSSAFYSFAAGASFLGVSALTWALVLIFAGGAGKSAMFPLHIWLPDAMEGPTPVSALIHAATMVVAGVFLVARLFPVFCMSHAAMDVVAYTGAASALIAALIACTQTDIKRVLAYSTMSQIGYMMFSLGISGYGGEKGLGYSAALFHLFTHAMFKALLFLCAGAVIHAVHSNEIKDMGGLKKPMPFTSIAFFFACLAISGIPSLSGFYSKEEILTAAFHRNKIIFCTGLLTAGITSFYMFRLYFSIFWNNKNKSGIKTHMAASITIPLFILTVATIEAGHIPFGKYVSSDGLPLHSDTDIRLSAAAIIISGIGILTAAFLYLKERTLPGRISAKAGIVYRFIAGKLYIDELYLLITKKVVFNLISAPAAWVDRNIVDGGMNLLGAAAENVSETIRPVQSGKIRNYALWFLAGTILISLFLIYVIR